MVVACAVACASALGLDSFGYGSEPGVAEAGDAGADAEAGAEAGADTAAAETGGDAAAETAADAAAEAGSDATCLQDDPSVNDASSEASIATCGDASGVDLLGSKDNCGVCGHSCNGDLCMGGFCATESLVVEDSGGPVTAATHDATNLYYVLNQQVARALPFDGGVVETITDISDAGIAYSAFPQLLVDDQTAYMRGYLTILTAPLQGGPVQLLANVGVGAMALTPDAVIVTSSTSVLAYDKHDGGLVATLASSETSADEVVATPDGGLVYWLRQPQGDGGLPAGLWAYDGHNELLVVNMLPDPVALAIDDAYVYWADRTTGDILRVPLGTFPASPQIVAQRPLEPQVVALAVDATHVYWFANSTAFTYDLIKVPKCGGRQTLVASSVGAVGGLVEAGGFLYFGTGPRLSRVAK